MTNMIALFSSENVVTSHVAFASQLVQTLTDEGITYALVGDVRKFPFEIPSDLDIVIEAASFRKFLRTLHDFCEVRNARIIQALQHEQSAWYLVCAWADGENTIRFLHPDVCSDYFRDGVLFLMDKDILEGRVQMFSQEDSPFSFYVPAPPKAFIYYLLKKVDKEGLSQTEGKFLCGEWKKDPAGARAQLTRFWNDEIVEVLVLAAREDKWDTVREALPRIKRSLRRTFPFSIRHAYAEFVRKIRRIRHPTGLHVAFLGIDGSGKSTILSKVSRDIAPAFRKTRQYHFRPFFGREITRKTESTLPHSGSFRGTLGSLAKLFWYLIDNTIGYFFFVFFYLIQSTLVSFDRCYYDLLMDPRRYRYGGPRWLVQVLEKFIPSPDLIFLLDAPPQVLNARKQEMSLDEITRLRKNYRLFADEHMNAHMIDVSKPEEEVEADVKELILNFMSQRTLQRLKL